MPKCIELLLCDWLNRYLHWQAVRQVYLLKWPVSAKVIVYYYCIDAIFIIIYGICWILDGYIQMFRDAQSFL